LQSRGMTRDLEWGVRLPKELGEKWEKKVMYVWVSRAVPHPPSSPSRVGARWLVEMRLLTDSALPVRRTDRIPFDHRQLHGRVEAMVEEPGERHFASVHGQGSSLFSLPLPPPAHPLCVQDNVPFHTVLFPGYLIGSGDNWTMLNSISTTGASTAPFSTDAMLTSPLS
jgi:hypothetical protein